MTRPDNFRVGTSPADVTAARGGIHYPEGSMSVTIIPEVGRTLYYYPGLYELCTRGPLAAKVVYVHGPTCVNLTVWDANGANSGRTSVELVQPGDPDPTHGGGFCRWMPWQVAQAETAARFEQVKRDIAAAPPGGISPERAAAKAADEMILRTAGKMEDGTGNGDDKGDPCPVAECGVKPSDPVGGPAPTADGPSASWVKKG
jgi:hypothetical protein